MSDETMSDDVPIPDEIVRMRAIVDAVSAPESLRRAVAAERERATPRRTRRRRFEFAGIGATVAAAAAIVLAVAIPGGGPTVLDAAALGVRPAVSAAPAVDPARPAVLQAVLGGVHFPAWGSGTGWTASGARTDELHGRSTRTVFYAATGGVRLGYTIVGGSALAWPKGSHTVVRNGVEVHVVRSGSRRIAVWRVDGHSCVLSGPASVPESALVALASSSTYG